jgi:hypothetical protein
MPKKKGSEDGGKNKGGLLLTAPENSIFKIFIFQGFKGCFARFSKFKLFLPQ